MKHDIGLAGDLLGVGIDVIVGVFLKGAFHVFLLIPLLFLPPELLLQRIKFLFLLLFFGLHGGGVEAVVL